MEKISDSLNIHTFNDLQLQALWVLEKISSDKQDRFSSLHIANYLIETCGINTSHQAIRYVLEKEKSLVHKNKNGYKLMEPGRKKLLDKLQNNISIEVKKPSFIKIVPGAKIDGLTMINNTAIGDVDFLSNEGELKNAKFKGNKHFTSKFASDFIPDEKILKVHWWKKPEIIISIIIGLISIPWWSTLFNIIKPIFNP